MKTAEQSRITELEDDIKTLRRERDECQFALGYDEGTLLENIKKIKAWANNEVKLAWEKNNNSIAYMEAQGDRLKKYASVVDALLQHCQINECEECSKIICPFNEPLHFHHDGCPACCNAPEGTKTWLDEITPPISSQYVKREVADKLARLLTRQTTGQTLQFSDYKEIQEALSLYEQQTKTADPALPPCQHRYREDSTVCEICGA